MNQDEGQHLTVKLMTFIIQEYLLQIYIINTIRWYLLRAIPGASILYFITNDIFIIRF